MLAKSFETDNEVNHHSKKRDTFDTYKGFILRFLFGYNLPG
jgi:hypothetical protein